MMYLNDYPFWLAVCAAYLLINFKTSLPRTFWFGLINFGCLSLLLSFKIAVICLLGACSIWLTLIALRYFDRHQNKGIAFQAIPWILILGIIGLFLLHKSNLDHSEILSIGYKLFERYSRIQTLFTLLTTLAFSYIFLRILDAIRAIKNSYSILDPISLLGYLIPFYMIAAGPVNSYTDYLQCNKKEMVKPTFDALLSAVNIITWGLFLKFVCAEGLRILVFGINGQLATGDIYRSAYIFLYVFFDFAGYSYVAYGIGKLLDIPTPLNFQKPYLSKTVTEFWTRWHVSLGDFVKRNIFMPAQVKMVRKFGVSNAYRTNLIALMASFTFVGIWHRLSVPFITWGIVMGGIVAFEKIARDWFYSQENYAQRASPILNKVGYLLGPCYVFAIIIGTLHFVMSDILG